MSLLELLVAMTSASLVGAAALTLLVTHAGVFGQMLEQTRAMADLAFAADVVGRDVQTAGGDPACSGVVALESAGPTGLRLRADRDGDGAIDRESLEEIEIAAGSGRRLVRRIGQQSMAIASDLAHATIDFGESEASAPAAGEPAASGVGVAAPARRVDLDLALERSWRGRDIDVATHLSAALRGGCTR